ncbi:MULTISPECIES: S-layer homology domain-containing protein [unclassified Leptolyngbya]|uniref:N-acetylmuramoyl-L-alanine amidase n=1 Tax=unclassified Leptolyngbya TaxID=2650499 RepID=UPI001683F419|nr:MULTISPECIES: S-layer homology domain-containing protein [unclassified Leptolyngbya]MBD2154628.1 S-layer homology domain-containing protein [Leptolyngbya sp. FACHB-16]
MVQATVTQTLYVNPVSGDDRGSGSQSAPYKTLTRALRRATSGTLIRLVPGRYGAANGETFPLELGAGVQIFGELANRGQSVVFEGGGDFLSPIFARQNTALRMGNGATVQGITVTNRNPRGTGIWVEDGAGAIANCTFLNCGREGILTTGNANVSITDSTFQGNAASGISLTRNSKGELRRNLFQQTGYGIAISDTAAPLLTENRVINNRAGIVISGSARPVLRNNQVEGNQADGLVVMNNAVPDLGQPQDPAGNIFRRNGESDVRNASAAPLLSVGNDLSPTRVNVNISGSSQGVEFQASEVNEQIRTVIPRPVPAPPTEQPPVTPPPPTTPPPTQPSPGTLPDVVGHWAEPFIRALVERSLIGGYPDGTFKPEISINRAQYAALIARAFTLPDRRSSSSFVDVPANFWAAEAIAKAEAMGFIVGFPDGTFRPTQNLTRVQATVSLVGGLELSGSTPETLNVYRDRAEIPTYATVPVAIATQKRLVVNHPDPSRFEPLIDITRAEIAVMIYQALVATGKARAIGSPYIVMPSAAAVSFSDVRSHWGEDFVRGLASQGFISGFEDGRFQPDGPITRAQYAAIMVNAFNPVPERAVMPFSDVPENHWAATAIQRAYRGRLLSGNADGTFRPDQNILRIEVILSLVNGLKLPTGAPTLVERYRDRDTIPSVAHTSVASATANNLVVSYPDVTQLNPTRAATRAEVSAMVYQALVYWGRSPAIPSPYIVTPTTTPPDSGTPTSSSDTTPLIVIDPGHGGTDTGSIGLNYLLEKNVNLAIALETARILQEFKFRVLLTRKDDRVLALEERVAIAEQAKADLFISIHANSAGSDHPEVNGTETYHYPNSTEGAELAQSIHNNITQAIETTNRGVKTANFLVLRQTTMPAVLVETGFVTGAADAPRLANPTFQNTVARAIAVGAFQFLEDPVG